MPRHIGSLKLLDAAVALDVAGIIPPDIATKAEHIRFYAVFGAGSSAGVVTIEGAHDPTYTGTWASLGVLTWAGAANNVQTVAVDGGHIAVRARVSTAVVGGSTDVWAVVTG